MFVSMLHAFSFQIMALRLPLTLVLTSPRFLWYALSIASDSATEVYLPTV